MDMFVNHCIHVYDISGKKKASVGSISGKKKASVGSKGIGELQFRIPFEYLSIAK